jgi:hypothetical protein
MLKIKQDLYLSVKMEEGSMEVTQKMKKTEMYLPPLIYSSIVHLILVKPKNIRTNKLSMIRKEIVKLKLMMKSLSPYRTCRKKQVLK